MDVNTVSKYPTHFLRGVELIKKARDEFRVPSENWPHPTEYRFGIPNDNYYAEVWIDGMDWQPSYWVIEEISYHKPKIQPFMIFDYWEERSKFNSYDFEEFISAMLWYRRDLLWLKHNNLGYYTDLIWSFLYMKDVGDKSKMAKYANNYFFHHASQPKVFFWVNEDFIPEEYRERKYGKGNRGSRNSSEEFLGSLHKGGEKSS
ncbi:MAG: hypothetical protein PVG65_05280 [Candidatus Thorarchaeota archaeon]|jgi:hypothetical protein